MIWDSPALMTLFDIAIVMIALVSLRVLYRHRQMLDQSRLLARAGTVVVGLFGIGVFYLADLFAMWGLPLFVPHSRAMAMMRELHLDYSWYVMLAGAASILVGFAYLIEGMFVQATQLREEVTRREQADVARRESESRERSIRFASPL